MTQTLEGMKRGFALDKGGALKGYSLVFIPRSWAVGVWHKPKKSIYALGPFRWAVHYGLGAWKPDEPFKPNLFRGQWLHGPSPSEHLTNADGTPSDVLAGGALEPRTPVERMK